MIDAFFARIDEAGRLAAASALSDAALQVSELAKTKAPVRKVFGDEGERLRLKTVEEIEGDREIRRRLGLGPERTHIMPPSIVIRAVPMRLADRRVVMAHVITGTGGRATVGYLMRSAAAFKALDRRGRYELRVGRAVHNGSLGGRLRDEIYATKAETNGRVMHARVVSPTPYAKYQEFGTRHNPAHPYLRPALHEASGRVRQEIGKRVRSEAARAVGSVFIDATVKMVSVG